MHFDNEKKFAATLSVISNTVLTVLKLVAGIISGSISIISETVHSLSDLLASAITYIAVSRSSLPADKTHPFGHGRYEDISGFIEGLLIIFASFLIIEEAIKKTIFGVNLETNNYIGIAAMSVSVIANFFVSRYLYKVAKKSESISLYADAEHLKTDILSSLGVLIGLVLIKFTGYVILDSIIAMLVALIILQAGFKISKQSFNNLLDCALPDSDIAKIKEIINSKKEVLFCKEIKSRRIGSEKKFEIVLVFDRNIELYKCHDVCNEIEACIRSEFDHVNIVIHQEPMTKSNN